MSNLYIHLLQTEKTSFCINTHGPNHSPQLFSAHYDPIQHTITIDPPPEYMQNIHQHHTKAHSFAELHDIIQRYTSNPYTIEISCRPNPHRFRDPFIAIVFHSKNPNIIQLQYQRPNHRAGTMLIPIAPWNMNNKQPAHTPFADIIAPIMKRFHAYYIFEYTIPHTNFHTHQLSYTHSIIPQHRIALKVRCFPSTPHSPPIISLGFSIHGICVHYVLMKSGEEGYAIPLQRLTQRAIAKIYRYQQETNISTHETIAICRALNTILRHHRANIYSTIAYVRRLYAIHYGTIPRYIATEPDITMPY